MLVVGVAGGIASGKSLVADYFRQMGAVVLDVDGLGHDVLQEVEVKELLVERFGDEVVDRQGLIDRSKLARLVFAPPPMGPAHLSYLEEVTHPRIGEKLVAEIARLAANNESVAILDAAVMFKAGWDGVCDHIVFVDASEAQRVERARARGWDAEQFHSRESAQAPLKVKRNKSDLFIDNSGSPEQTFQQVQQIWQQITS